MLKINIYSDFGQFVAALKAAEELDLRYTVERRWIAATRPRGLLEMPMVGTSPHDPVDASSIEYTLTILPDEPAEEEVYQAV